MAKVKIYNQEGKSAGEMELAESLFNVAPKSEIVHEAVRVQEANSRPVLAHTKTRGDVRGGGRKPWKQKGTGRARHGSTRSPIWKGGGVTFGPLSNRNYSLKISRKKKLLALAMSLTDKLRDDRFVVVDTMSIPEAKTKMFASMLAKLPVTKSKKMLVIVNSSDIATKRAGKNIPKVSLISANSLNVRDIVNNDYLIVSKDGVELIERTYAKK
ncbi:MAG: 50S ribosomal protein L4 [uncultured bacterium]|nr:MAG: 50S ribosomal protein L4 [uncultured bacterium]HBD05264.1 50S ribosomal protein L4 [Candidatus Uhrbacteria bacterium]